MLLAREVGTGHSFLPGGHAKSGETLPAALKREIREETGLAAEVGSYLGAVEHAWKDGRGLDQWEINHVFQVTTPGLEAGVHPLSRENHLEFFWSSLGNLDREDLRPPPLIGLIRRWDGGDRSPWWGTTLQR